MKSFSQQFSAGLRFKMRYESDDASERRLVFSKTLFLSYMDLLRLTHESIMQMHWGNSRNWWCWPHVAWFEVEMFDGMLPLSFSASLSV